MLSPEVYHQALLTLLGGPKAELCVIGQLNPALRQLLADENVHAYDDIKQCLEADASMQPASALMMVQADSIDSLPNLLGTICRRFPHQVLIELQHVLNDKTAAFDFRQACFALGFRQALHSVSDASEYQLYEYRLKNYKQAPDWLNSRFWANPERFNTR